MIVAIHGYCFGAGVDLSACCDIRYSSRDATFSIKVLQFLQMKYRIYIYVCLHFEEVDIGLAADVGTLQILPKLIADHGLFRELVLTSRTFDAIEAQQIGLIT